MTRGDNVSIIITIYDQDKNPFPLQQGDLLEFTLKESAYTDKVFVYKQIEEFEDNIAIVEIMADDTKGMRFGKYYFDVQLTRDGQVMTVVKPKMLTIGEEITC